MERESKLISLAMVMIIATSIVIICFLIFKAFDIKSYMKSLNLPDCDSPVSRYTLQKILSQNVSWVKDNDDFDPSISYTIDGIFIYKKGNADLRQSYCKAMIRGSSSTNSSYSYYDVYYIIQNTLSGNNTEMYVLPPR